MKGISDGRARNLCKVEPGGTLVTPRNAKDGCFVIMSMDLPPEIATSSRSTRLHLPFHPLADPAKPSTDHDTPSTT